MTFQEAVEYLNLPANSSDKLVNKRYLELKIDYQKAINNAPSDHFRALYQENLDKIEEAYEVLTQRQRITKESNLGILTTLQETQEIVDHFLTDQGEELLNPEAIDIIQTYIDQINGFQDDLREEETEKQPSKVSMPSDRWDLKETLLDTPDSKATSPITESANQAESDANFESTADTKKRILKKILRKRILNMMIKRNHQKEAGGAGKSNLLKTSCPAQQAKRIRLKINQKAQKIRRVPLLSNG